MKRKILIADDSQNIQKVINLVLSQKDYQVTNCESTDEVLEEVKSDQTHLVLLDFTLSDDKDGYELTQLIKSQSPKTKIIMMFGTFDTVEDEKIKESQIDSYIYKPFDGDKLISLIEEQLTSFDDDEAPVEIIDNMAAEELSFSDDEPLNLSDDEEALDLSSEDDDESIDLIVASKKKDKSGDLDDIDQWGVNIPDIIDEEDDLPPQDMPIPPSDDESDSKSAKEGKHEANIDSSLFPSDDDLEYPEMGLSETEDEKDSTFSLEEETKSVFEDDNETSDNTPPSLDDDPAPEVPPLSESSAEKTLNFLSADELVPDEREDTEDREENTDLIDIPSLNDRAQEITKIQEKINAELEEEEWEAEEVEEKKDQFITSLNQIQNQKIIDEKQLKESIKNELIEEFKTTLLQDLYQDIKKEVISDLEQSILNKSDEIKKALALSLRDELKTEVKPHLEKEVSQYCREAVEKDIWEILPELADKVIKNELRALRESL